MRYTVAWNSAAVAQLAAIWNGASDQDAVTAATERIDKRLRYSPETAGKPLGDRRYLVYPPLAATFMIDPADCKVEVTYVWRW